VFLGIPGNSGKVYPHLVASLAQPFVIKLKVYSCCIPFKSVSVGKRILVSIYDLNNSISDILTFISVSLI